MDKIEVRDTVLKALYEFREEQPAPSSLSKILADRGIHIEAEEVAEAYEWMLRNDLVNNEHRPLISALGEHFVELGESVRKLSDAAVQGAIKQNIQHNISHGDGGVFSQGDGNTFHVNNQKLTSAISDAIETLRENGDESRAKELEIVQNQEGPVAAAKMLSKWVSNNLLSAKMISAVSPILAMIIQVAFG